MPMVPRLRNPGLVGKKKIFQVDHINFSQPERDVVVLVYPLLSVCVCVCFTTSYCIGQVTIGIERHFRAQVKPN